MYTFDDSTPEPGGLVLANDGNFYGAAGDSIYQITPKGGYTTVANFNGSDPSLPVQGTDGNLYWPAQFGGNGYGIVFESSLAGSLSALYGFSGYPDDGSYPLSNLVQATNGTFYGTTYAGGSSPCNYSIPGCGTIFSEDLGLGPFVAFMHGAARVGQKFGLLGQGFTGTTSVSLNGTPATFTIKSDTLIGATVPAGATTGYVTVTTPSGTLTSNVSFHVIP